MHIEETKPVRLKIETIQLLKTIKVTHRYKTYDDLIISAAKILSNSEITGEKSKADILLKNDYDLLKRQEQFFKRLGALENLYFKNILNFSDLLIDSENRISKKINDLEIPKKNTNNDHVLKNDNEDKKLKIELEFLKNHSKELEILLKKKNEKIKILESKFVKKNSMFSSNYEASISDEEYKNLF
jgi:hypothetical protein